MSLFDPDTNEINPAVSEEALFDEIIRRFLHHRALEDKPEYPSHFINSSGTYTNNPGAEQIQRVKHGGMHASRTALHSEKIISLLQEANYEPAKNLTAKDRFLIKVAALFHDAGRKKDSGGDCEAWERDGANKAYEWLITHEFSEAEALKVQEAIYKKDDRIVQESNVYALILAGSDSLDWVRSHSSDFRSDAMPFLVKENVPSETLVELAKVAKKIAVAQGDSPRGEGRNFDIEIKKKYEHSPEGCYTATKKLYQQFSADFAKVTLPKPIAAPVGKGGHSSKVDAHDSFYIAPKAKPGLIPVASPKEPTIIDLKDFKLTCGKKGTNSGGFYRHNGTNKEYYIKWLPAQFSDSEKRTFYKSKFFNGEEVNLDNKDKLKDRHRNRFNNEVLATRIYELYGVAVPRVEFISFTNSEGELCYGVMSEKIPTLEKIQSKLQDPDVKFKIQEDFLIDVLLSNYDVAGTGLDNIFFDTATQAPCRLDAGGALYYLAKGAAKKEITSFDTNVGEFEDMRTGLNEHTKFNPASLSTAGKLFQGIETSPALCISLRKLLSVSDQQLKDCIDENGFIGGANKDKLKNQNLKNILYERKNAIITKALELIVTQLDTLYNEPSSFLNYLERAGINKEAQNEIIQAWKDDHTYKEGFILSILEKSGNFSEQIKTAVAIDTSTSISAKENGKANYPFCLKVLLSLSFSASVLLLIVGAAAVVASLAILTAPPLYLMAGGVAAAAAGGFLFCSSAAVATVPLIKNSCNENVSSGPSKSK